MTPTFSIKTLFEEQYENRDYEFLSKKYIEECVNALNISDKEHRVWVDNLDINKAYMSIVYVKRVTSQTSGNFYHGTGAGTNEIFNLNGTANTNPYFVATGISNIPQDVWCVSIGYIQANNDSNTSASAWYKGGIYRLDTGAKIADATPYKMGVLVHHFQLVIGYFYIIQMITHRNYNLQDLVFMR